MGRLPDIVVACVGGGSNAIGIFDGFIDDRGVRLVGVEAGGERIAPGRHAARFAGGATGVLQGTRTYVLQDEAGNIELTHSISAGLDYAAVGPEHAGCASSVALSTSTCPTPKRSTGFQALARLEGILPALESAHAIAYTTQLARDVADGTVILVNLSGRGDKDVQSGDGGDANERRRSCSRAAWRRHLRACAAHRTGQASSPMSRRAIPICPEPKGSCARSSGPARMCIEVGVPFSDPLADGPVIQRATERALAAGTTLAGVLDMIGRVRADLRAPIVIFSYANPILRLGAERFADRARRCGGGRRAGARSADRGGG